MLLIGHDEQNVRPVILFRDTLTQHAGARGRTGCGERSSSDKIASLHYVPLSTVLSIVVCITLVDCPGFGP